MSTLIAPAVPIQCSYTLVAVAAFGFVVTVERKFPTLILKEALTKVHQLSSVHLPEQE